MVRKYSGYMVKTIKSGKSSQIYRLAEKGLVKINK